jgi:hypothetical protein
MAQFQVFTSNSEVSGKMVSAVLKAVPGQEAKIRSMFAQNNIENPEDGKWYAMQDYLNAFQEIFKTFGPSVLFSIGKFLPKNGSFSTPQNSLANAINQMDTFYHEWHRGGEVGHYRLVSYSNERKEAKIECKNPYPCYFDRGILTAISKEYKPDGASLINVELDSSRPNRLAGSDVSYYNIVWV